MRHHQKSRPVSVVASVDFSREVPSQLSQMTQMASAEVSQKEVSQMAQPEKQKKVFMEVPSQLSQMTQDPEVASPATLPLYISFLHNAPSNLSPDALLSCMKRVGKGVASDATFFIPLDPEITGNLDRYGKYLAKCWETWHWLKGKTSQLDGWVRRRCRGQAIVLVRRAIIRPNDAHFESIRCLYRSWGSYPWDSLPPDLPQGEFESAGEWVSRMYRAGGWKTMNQEADHAL
jgi:hypothetical protein